MSYEQFAQYRLIEAAIGGALFLLITSGVFLYKTITDIRRGHKSWERELRRLEQEEEVREDKGHEGP